MPPPPAAVVLDLPFAGTWRVENSPARRVPSHGTHLFATTYAIDFVQLVAGRSARVRDWRTVLGTEPNERFTGFGQPLMAPAAGTVVAVLDGEPDHAARRSPLTLLGYAATQPARVRAGAGALAGNHVVIELDSGSAHVVLAHLRRGSLEVHPGQHVRAGQPVGACGNSGNSTQPHLHLQVMDGPDPWTARGLPLAFRSYRVVGRRGQDLARVDLGVPGEAEVVAPT